MNKSWLQRLFGRDTEQAYSILPDDAETETEDEQFEAPVQSHGIELVSPAAVHPELMDLPLRETEAATAEPVPAAPAYVAPSPVLVAAVIPEVVPVVELPEPVAAQPYVPPFIPAQIHQVSGPVAMPEPVRALPAKPLSFAELTQLRGVEPAPIAVTPVEETPLPVSTEIILEAADAQREPVAVTPAPEPVAIEPEIVTELMPSPVVESAPALELVPEPRTQTSAPEEGDLEDWVAEPLNRWDPIPPLRAEEPWRSRQFRAAGSGAQESVHTQEDPLRIPPTDRWGAPEAAYPSQDPVETPEIVLTRRWGLLSRFQQGDTFPANEHGVDHEEESSIPAYQSERRS